MSLWVTSMAKDWVAVQELNLSYQNRGILYITGFTSHNSLVYVP